MTIPRDGLVKTNKGLYHNETLPPTTVSGSFTIGAAATFYPTQTGGQGCTITRTGAGLYLATMADTDIVSVLSAVACIQDTAGAHTDLIARFEEPTVGAATTIPLETYAAAVATDVLTANNLACHFEITYRRVQQADTDELGYWHHVTDAVKLVGSVDIGAVGAVGVHHGAGFTMTRTGAGDFLLTFADAFNGFLGGHVNAGHGAGVGGDLSANFGTFTAGAAGAATLEVGTQVAAVATDPTAGARIYFVCYLNSEATGA